MDYALLAFSGLVVLVSAGFSFFMWGKSSQKADDAKRKSEIKDEQLESANNPVSASERLHNGRF